MKVSDDSELLKYIVDEFYNSSIEQNKIVWPESYTKQNKIEFFDMLIGFYEEDENYDKCSKLRNLKTEYEDN